MANVAGGGEVAAAPLIDLREIEKVYKLGELEVHALNGVSLTVRDGEFVAIMGTSGSGKSTLMNLIGCLDRPTRGSYRLAGEEVARLDRGELSEVRSRRIGFIFQSFNLLRRTSALENVELPLVYAGVGAAERRARAREALVSVGLGDRLGHQPSQLSGGQQQRVAIARALVTRPSLLVADEPTGNLDSRTSEEVMALLHKLSAEGLTILLVTHEAELATNAQRIITLRDGKVVSDEASRVDSVWPSGPQTSVAVRANREARAPRRGGLPLLSTIRVAGRALLLNKMRSFLTMLGVIIGVLSVIAMVAIGEGAKASVEQAFASLGTNLIIVQPGATTAGGVRSGFGGAQVLSLTDLAALQSEAKDLHAGAPMQRGGQQVRSEDANWMTTVIGTTPDYSIVRDAPTTEGAWFTDGDVQAGAKVCLIGQTAAKELFGGDDPVGQSVRVQNAPFRILGLLEPKGQSPFGQDQDDVLIVPFSTYQESIAGGQRGYAGTFILSATVSGGTDALIKEVTAILRDRHHLTDGQDDDFQIKNLSDVAASKEQSTKTLELLLGGIAAVSLLVGGIGIMNIMLVSVTERTREIGLRVAIGARRSDILLQFLAEALTLSLTGGLLGITLGVGTANLVARIAGWPTLVQPQIIVLAAGFSAAVGIFFGFYPARKAAELDPIEALRYE